MWLVGGVRARKREKVRWGLLAGCFAGGAALIGCAFAVEATWGWQGVTVSVLSNLGVALALAGVLFLLERRFTVRVGEVTERAARRAAETVETRMQERTDQLAARLDEIQADVMQRMRQRTDEQDAKLAAIRENVSYETITTAMTEANRLVAIHEGSVTVPASRRLGGLALTFSWGEDCDINSLRLDGPHLGISAGAVEVEWRRNDWAAEVGYRLVEELQRAGAWDGESALDWGLALRNLQRSLEIAISSRRRDRHRWHLSGPLIEMATPTWALTTAGVEHLGQGLLFPENNFPEPIPRELEDFNAAARQMADSDREWCPDPPATVDPAEWAHVIERGKRVFPFTRTFVTTWASSKWVPWGSTPEHGERALRADETLAANRDGRA
jgi:hypothetical protein